MMEGYHHVDLRPIANFHGLKSLTFRSGCLNGRYPFLFNFLHLERLEFLNCGPIKFDLADLSGLPALKHFRASYLDRVTGNLGSVSHLQSILVTFCVESCENMKGSLHELANFPVLEKVNVDRTSVEGDIRNIGPDDFPSLRELEVSEKVYGGGDLQSIADSEAIMLAKYHLKKRNKELFRSRRWRLSDRSAQYYEAHCHHSRKPPFLVEFVEAGPRIGWRWTNAVTTGDCETNWSDPEITESDEGYEEYTEDLERIERGVDFYRGFHSPPTRSQHSELCNSIPLDPILQRHRTEGFLWDSGL